jgi:hypothetical protein
MTVYMQHKDNAGSQIGTPAHGVEAWKAQGYRVMNPQPVDPWEGDYPGKGSPQDTDRPEDDPAPQHECEGHNCGGRKHS